MVNSCHKGKAGEVEFCKWLDENLGISAERRYNQAEGGSDVVVDDFVFEIKRQESLLLGTWWYQLVTAVQLVHNEKDLEPVVAFRQNRKKWRFLISATHIGLERGYVELEEERFVEFAKKVMKNGSKENNSNQEK